MQEARVQCRLAAAGDETGGTREAGELSEGAKARLHANDNHLLARIQLAQAINLTIVAHLSHDQHTRLSLSGCVSCGIDVEVWPRRPFQRVPQQQQQPGICTSAAGITELRSSGSVGRSASGRSASGQGSAGGADVPDDGRPMQVPTPDLLNGRMLVYPSGFECQKCTSIFSISFIIISYIQFY